MALLSTKGVYGLAAILQIAKASEVAPISIKEIAERLGFSDEYYFSAVFKIHEGVPPGVFRTSMKIR